MKARKRSPKGLGVVRERVNGTWEARVSWHKPSGKRTYRSAVRKTEKAATLALVDLRAKYAPGSVDRTEDVPFEAFLKAWLAANERRWAIVQIQQGTTVETTAALLGYAESRSFTRAFRQWTGCSPLQFRRNYLAGR